MGKLQLKNEEQKCHDTCVKTAYETQIDDLPTNIKNSYINCHTAYFGFQLLKSFHKRVKTLITST